MTNLVLFVLVCFKWAANPATSDGELAGYRLYQGTASGAYTNATFIPKDRTRICASMLRGSTNYFALTAVGTNGLESLPTPELMQWSDAPSIVRRLQESTNLSQWRDVAVQTNYVKSSEGSLFYRDVLEFR